MRTFPILRDLVTDVSYNYEVAKRIPPFTPRPKTADEEEAGGYRMQQIDVERSQEFRKCIECFLCQDVCHVIRDHEENKTAFAGPRFFARSAELEMHPLDVNDRRELLQQEQGLGKCNITKCCTEVCPEHIKITDNAIIPLKERVVDATYDPVAWLGRKILNRTKRHAGRGRRGRRRPPGPAAVQPRPRSTASPLPANGRRRRLGAGHARSEPAGRPADADTASEREPPADEPTPGLNRCGRGAGRRRRIRARRHGPLPEPRVGRRINAALEGVALRRPRSRTPAWPSSTGGLPWSRRSTTPPTATSAWSCHRRRHRPPRPGPADR